MEWDMKPSSKIWLVGLVAIVALWPAVGEAGSPGRVFGVRPFFHPRPVAPPLVRSPNGVLVERGFNARLLHRRLPTGAFGGTSLPYGWEWTAPAYGSGPFEGDGQFPLPVPAFYGPPQAIPLCNEPRIIDLAPMKRDANLPRVVYGTPPLCAE
jgi:hypothetical protein